MTDLFEAFSEVHAGADGLLLFAKFILALC